jgi:predicted permease
MALLGRKRHDGEPARALENERSGRRRLESFFLRLVATGGIVGIGTAVAAVLGTQDVSAWVIGLVVAILSVILAAILWSSRTLER